MKYFFAARHDLGDVFKAYTKYWGQSNPEDSEVIVALGGDGFMLTVLHQYVMLRKPFYGIRFGSVGYMMHDAVPIQTLDHHIRNRCVIDYVPLSVTFSPIAQEPRTYLAFNDVSVYRRRYQALKLNVWIDDVLVCPVLMGDGIVCASRLGASAYYRASGGIELQAEHSWGINALHASPECSWRGSALLPYQRVQVEILHQDRRPAVLGWDGQDQELPTLARPILIAPAKNYTVRIVR